MNLKEFDEFHVLKRYFAFLSFYDEIYLYQLFYYKNTKVNTYTRKIIEINKRRINSYKKKKTIFK